MENGLLINKKRILTAEAYETWTHQLKVRGTANIALVQNRQQKRSQIKKKKVTK